MDCAYFCLSILLTISSVITCLTNLERYSEDMFTDFKDISNMMLYYLCVTFVCFFFQVHSPFRIEEAISMDTARKSHKENSIYPKEWVGKVQQSRKVL